MDKSDKLTKTEMKREDYLDWTKNKLYFQVYTRFGNKITHPSFKLPEGVTMDEYKENFFVDKTIELEESGKLGILWNLQRTLYQT